MKRFITLMAVVGVVGSLAVGCGSTSTVEDVDTLSEDATVVEDTSEELTLDFDGEDAVEDETDEEVTGEEVTEEETEVVFDGNLEEDSEVSLDEASEMTGIVDSEGTPALEEDVTMLEEVSEEITEDTEATNEVSELDAPVE